MALMALSLASLSGCLGFGGDEESNDDHDDACEGLEGAAHDECHDDGNGNQTGNHTDVPNVAPQASLALFDAGGNALGPQNAVVVGQNITFSANGSMDPDGNISLAALTVTDGNGTRTVSMLQDGALVAVNLTIEKEGPVTAVLRVLDEHGDGAVAANFTYANEVQVKSDVEPTPAPATGVGACEGPSGSNADSPLVDNYYSSAPTFKTVNGTQWISAKVISGGVDITICDPEKKAVSDTGKDVSTPQGQYPPGVNYYVFVVNRGSTDEEWTVEWISHWEPKPE